MPRHNGSATRSPASTRSERRRSPMPRCSRRRSVAFTSCSSVERMSYISGIPNLVADPPLVGGGIHETNHGGHLDVHVDFNVNESTGLFRRLHPGLLQHRLAGRRRRRPRSLGRRCPPLPRAVPAPVQPRRRLRDERDQLARRDPGHLRPRPDAPLVRGVLLHRRAAAGVGRRQAIDDLSGAPRRALERQRSRCLWRTP